ncbi:MAG: MFS transporter, partial [Pseudomonadota bacterium]|nr:MFS transporter [Pseudomonadota bacterium]
PPRALVNPNPALANIPDWMRLLLMFASEQAIVMYTLRQLIIPCSLAGLIGYQSLTVLPIILGALVDYRGFTLANVGYVGSVEILGMALAVAVTTGLINRVRRNRLAFSAAIALGLTQISSAFTLDPSLFFAERFLAGLSAGCMAGVLASTIALAREPERLTAFIYLIDALLASAFYLGLPLVIARFELAGAYALLGAVTILISPAFLMLPTHGPVAKASADFRNDALRVIAFAIILSAATAALWTFTERMALHIGLTVRQVGQVFAGGLLVGIMGASLAAWVGDRFGSARPIMLAWTMVLVLALAVPYLPTPAAFILGFCLLRFFMNVNDPFIVGVVARLDVEGRLTTIFAASGLFGAAIGPFLASTISGDGDFTRLGWAFLLMGSCAFILFAQFLKRPEITRTGTQVTPSG